MVWFTITNLHAQAAGIIKMSVLRNWVCVECGDTIENDQASSTPEHCGKPMRWEQTSEGSLVEDQPDAQFDFAYQVYRDLEGEEVETKKDWDFPCPLCNGGSKLESVGAFGEWHVCTHCNHGFNVC